MPLEPRHPPSRSRTGGSVAFLIRIFGLCILASPHLAGQASGSDVGLESAVTEKRILDLTQDLPRKEPELNLERPGEPRVADGATNLVRRAMEEAFEDARRRGTEPPARLRSDGLRALMSVERDLEGANQPAQACDEVKKGGALPAGAPAGASASQRFAIGRLLLTGDVELLDLLGLRRSFESDAVGKTLTAEEIVALGNRYRRICIGKGYYLASVKKAPSSDLARGLLVYDVDRGRYGRMKFEFARVGPGAAERGGAASGPSATGKHFSEAQLRRALSALAEGSTFNYSDFYAAIFSVNTHPDLTMDVDLITRNRMEEGRPFPLQYADMVFKVQEDLPVHVVLDARNSGTESTGEWRVGTTLQHLNFTKRDDVLTLNMSVSPDFATMRSGAASYHIPHYCGKGGACTFYGGYSRIDALDVAESIDVQGQGWFGGAQFSSKLVSSRSHSLSMHLGAVYRRVADNLVFNDESMPPTEVSLVPVSVALSYASARPDVLGGRNFVTLQTTANAGGSSDAELAEMRRGARSDYVIHTAQFARVQPLFGRATDRGDRIGQWVLFCKLDGQSSSKPLIPAEQKAVGGADTVRGYLERESKGDSGLSGTLELRTPVLEGFPSSGAGSSVERVQLVLFADAGYVNSDEPQTGDKESERIASAGIGLRMSLTSHAQLKFDWGVPLEETSESKSPGRGHVHFQVQF